MKTCTCPHDAGGGERVALDQMCPVHGSKVVVPVPAPAKWCLDCGTEHAPGLDCPDYD